jgi:hypothetical protein
MCCNFFFFFFLFFFLQDKKDPLEKILMCVAFTAAVVG